MSHIPYGASPIIEGSFTDPDSGDALDPAALRFVLRQAGGSETTYTYGTHNEIVKTATGEYEARLQPPAASTTWFWRWEADDENGLPSVLNGDFVVGPNRT